MDCELNLQIAEPFQGAIDEGWLGKVVEQTLAAHGVAARVELGLVIADDEFIQELNRTYRGVDATTDVLAFALWDDGFVAPLDDTVHLGEVLLSYPQAERQARERGQSLEQELALLVVHGVLHLLEYDDEAPEAEQRMRAMEEKVLALLFREGR